MRERRDVEWCADLTCTPLEPSSVELTDKDLSTVSAGKSGGFVNFGQIKGETTDDRHRDWA